MTTLRTLIARAATILLALTLAACGSKGNPADPPIDVTAVAGDGQVTLSWTPAAGVEYWVFYAPDTTMTLSNWSSISTARAKVGAVSPQVIDGLTNGSTYTLIVNGRTDGGKGGVGSTPVYVTPRLAGNAYLAGTPVPVTSLNGVTGANVTISGTTYKGLWAVGTGGTIWTSTDGSTWIGVTSPVTADLNAVAFGNNNSWVAVGNAGAVTASINAPTGWTAYAPVTTERLNGVAIVSGNVTAVGDNGVIVFGSGVTSYSLAASPTARTLRAVASGNGEAIAVGDGGTILRSTDGLNYVARTSPTTADLYGVAWGNSRWVAVGAGGVVITSTDGITWTTVASPVATDLLSIVFGSQFVAVGRGGQIVTTVDTGTWALGSSGVSTDLRAVGWGLAQYTAVGSGGVNVYSR